MKVDMKIVPVEIKDGWFKKKLMHRLQYLISLTDVEKAIINKAGLREFSYLEFEQHNKDRTYSETLECPIWPWVDQTVQGHSHCDFETLIEAQAMSQKLKANLVRLKEAMDHHTNTPTEDSFEI